MTTKIQKWGNSYGIRLPKSLLDSGVFSVGATLELETKGKEVILKEIKKPKMTLKEAMKGLTRADFEPVIDWGPDVGNEIIHD
jgi:antitoxin MazE